MFGKKEDIEKEIQKVEGEAISSIIDGSMTLTGEISFKGKTRIDGIINGNIQGEHLILSKAGKINGDITVSSSICQGAFTGNLETKILTAKKGCSIHGKIIAGSLTVEPGASLEGEIKAATKDLHLDAGSFSTAKPKTAETTGSSPDSQKK
jgi:cytoskeletal protein CcmA (bactofilin family)